MARGEIGNMRRKIIKEFRLVNKYSQAKMAEILGIAQPEYSKLENGKKEFTDDIVRTLVSIGALPKHEDPVSLPDMVKDAMELLDIGDQEMLMLMAKRMLS